MCEMFCAERISIRADQSDTVRSNWTLQNTCSESLALWVGVLATLRQAAVLPGELRAGHSQAPVGINFLGPGTSDTTQPTIDPSCFRRQEQSQPFRRYCVSCDQLMRNPEHEWHINCCELGGAFPVPQLKRQIAYL